MTDELLFPHYNWFPEVGCFVIYVALLIGLYYFRRVIIKIDRQWADILFHVIMLTVAIVLYFMVFYEDIDYHGVGIEVIEYFSWGDYSSLRFGWYVFIILQGVMAGGVGQK